MASAITSNDDWKIVYSFDCCRDVTMRILSKGRCQYIDVRKFYKKKPTKFGVCLNLMDSIELYRKLQNIDGDDFLSLAKASCKITNKTGFLVKGDKKVFMDRKVWSMFNKYLFVGLQMILLPEKDEIYQKRKR